MYDTFTTAKTELHKTIDWAVCGPRVGHSCFTPRQHQARSQI